MREGNGRAARGAMQWLTATSYKQRPFSFISCWSQSSLLDGSRRMYTDLVAEHIVHLRWAQISLANAFLASKISRSIDAEEDRWVRGIAEAHVEQNLLRMNWAYPTLIQVGRGKRVAKAIWQDRSQHKIFVSVEAFHTLSLSSHNFGG